jgi:hypothetical protein
MDVRSGPYLAVERRELLHGDWGFRRTETARSGVLSARFLRSKVSRKSLQATYTCRPLAHLNRRCGVFFPAFFAAHMRLAASAIRARPSGLMERLARLVFLDCLPVFSPAAASAALFSAHRLRVASAILARPAALICLFPPRLFLPGGLPSFF